MRISHTNLKLAVQSTRTGSLHSAQRRHNLQAVELRAANKPRRKPTWKYVHETISLEIMKEDFVSLDLRNLDPKEINLQDGNGFTLLHWAIIFKALKCVRFLIVEKQASRGIPDASGKTPDMLIAEKGYLEELYLPSEGIVPAAEIKVQQTLA